ncbi:MAG: threonine ammonia-lyase, biosynthetic [Ectothiorhodospiraceae bacterium]|nr:threonine ammonia-lyase, biosynthetic [Chromatiales bacterium]MCP5156764.1 threonine ammonia-lyase, biosynthetic [Ectothiorhodospiraceae bacterium]
MSREYLERILRAPVYALCRETPLDPAPRLSRRVDNRVLLKREDLQPVFSFKLRGAYNKLHSLGAEERARGVICSSAGNHAQGVAMAARALGIRALIVMPQTTPRIKVEAVAELGAEIVLHGGSYDEARERADALAAERDMVFVHPFDDPEVIAGQGTIAMEILRQHPAPIDAIFVAVGGGGLITGIGAYVKALWPQVRIIGVEPEDAPSMHHALAAGERVKLDRVGIFADGVAVAQVGVETFRLAQEVVDEVILVTTDEICAAIKDIFEDTRSIAEPAGALGVAGLKRYVEREGWTGRTLVAIDCGANINFDRLRHVAERAEVGEQREALLAVTIPEEPGSLRRFCELLGERSITEFNYRYADRRDAHIFVGIELRDGAAERAQIVEALRAGGYPALDLTDDEMAKLHVRYMVGGHTHGAADEVLYRFQFPERPGALLRFLARMGRQWNISLFHYRNHGSDHGRVLMGLQVPSGESAEFERFLDDIGYPYVEESSNPAYRLFLS